MHAAIIKNGVVENIIEVEDLSVFPGLVGISNNAAVGDLYKDGVFTKPQVIVPPEESNARILHELTLIDLKSIRALREGNQTRIDALEAEAATLRLLIINT